MNPSTIAVVAGGITAIISAVAALAGIFVGRRLDARLERERYLRERRTQAYEELAVQYFKLREALRRVALLALDSAEAEDRVEEARQVGVDWNRAVIGVWVHGSPTAAISARDIDHQVNDLFKLSRSKCLSIDEWYEERESIQRTVDGYLGVVRDELGLPTLEVRLSNYTHRP